jgi:predicted ester cyclase
MSTEDNKALVRHFTEEIWNRGHVALLDELVDSHFVSHDPHVPVQGPEQFKQFVLMYRSAFSDASFSIEEQIAEGDQVVTRYTERGTHRGTFLGNRKTCDRDGHHHRPLRQRQVGRKLE